MAVGRISAKAELVRLTEVNRSGLSGLFFLKDYLLDATKQIRVMSLLEAKRLAYLENVWSKQDFPDDQPPDDVIIDPDLISRLDLRNPVPGNVVFDLWKKRREWVDQQLLSVKKVRGSNKPDEAISALMSQSITYDQTTLKPWDMNTGVPQVTEFGTLRKALFEGASPEEYEKAQQVVTKALHLSLDSFQRLLTLLDA